MNFVASDEVRSIRDRLDHPVIDGDGHLIEYLPMVRDLIVDIAGADVATRFDQVTAGSSLLRQVPPSSRRAVGLSRSAWWGLPTRNTLDRATAMLPRLMYERLDELGIDFALLYPTYGLVVTAHPDAEVRQALARGCNTYVAQAYGEYRDRLEPVASIPMFTPDEAVAELEYAVGELGLKSVMMAGVVPRPFPGFEDSRCGRWIDTLGHDSVHDYDPVWAACERLGVAPTFHAGGQGWGTRMSGTNYVYNHLGNFAAAGEAAARSLFMGGVPRRFPKLRFAFLEGGVAWGANLYSDIIGHYEKRNRTSIAAYDPAELDRERLAELFLTYAEPGIESRIDRLEDGLAMLSDPDEDPATIDEFAASGIGSTDDIRDVFTRQYFFGCEADDPMNAMAFDRGLNPGGARLRAIFASDVGHWDVPDFRGVLPEAYELVDEGRLDESDFAHFVFTNAVELLGSVNPDYFNGTVVADEAASVLAHID